MVWLLIFLHFFGLKRLFFFFFWEREVVQRRRRRLPWQRLPIATIEAKPKPNPIQSQPPARFYLAQKRDANFAECSNYSSYSALGEWGRGEGSGRGRGAALVATLFGAFLANSVKPAAAEPVAYSPAPRRVQCKGSREEGARGVQWNRVSRCDNFSKRTAPAKRPQNRWEYTTW